MKTILWISLIILCIACNKVVDPGVIHEKLSMPECFEKKLVQDSYVIRSQAEFDSIQVSNNCYDNLPSVDFGTYSVIAKYTEGKCKVSFERQVLVNESQQKYTYTIFVEEKGKCDDLKTSMNWVSVPRIPDFYTVEFVVSEK